MNSEHEAFELVDRLEAFFKENAAPLLNEKAVRTIGYLCSRISTVDDYIAEKCGDIEGLVNTFYTAERHKKHRGGAEGIYELVMNNLDLIRRRLKNIHRGN